MEAFKNNTLEIDEEESNSRNTSLLRSESFEEEMRELQSFTKIEAQCELEEEIGRLRHENKLLHAKYSDLLKLYQTNLTQNYQVRIPTDTYYKQTYLPVIQETDERESLSPEVPLQGSLEDVESVLDYYNEDCDNGNLNESSVSCCDNFIPKAVNMEEDDISDAVFEIKKKLHVLYKLLDGPDDDDSMLSSIFQKVCKAICENSQSSDPVSLQDLKKKLKYLSSYVENLINKQQDFCETFYNCLSNETENKFSLPMIEECRNNLAESFAIDLNLKVITDDVCLKIEHLCKENDSYKELTLLCDTILELVSSENCHSDTKLNKIEKNLETLNQLMGILQDIINIMNITNKTDSEKRWEDTLNKSFMNEKLQNSFTRFFSLVEFINLNFKDLKAEYLHGFQKLSFLKTFWLKCCKFPNSKDNINERKQLVTKVSEEFQEEKSRLILEVQKQKSEYDLLTNRMESSIKEIDTLTTENFMLKKSLEKYTEEQQHIQKRNKELEELLHEKTLALKSKEDVIVNCSQQIIEETNRRNKISQDYHTALNKIEELEIELTKSRKVLAQQNEKFATLEQKHEEFKEIYCNKIEKANQEIEKLQNNLLLNEKTLYQAKKERDEISKQNSELKRKNEIVTKLQKDMQEIIAEKEHHEKQTRILKIKLQNFSTLQNVLTDKTEAYKVLLATLKEKSTQEDIIITKIETELKYLENQIKLKREPITLFVLKLMEMFKIFKQALVKSHNTFIQTQSEKICNLESLLAEQKKKYQKIEEESDIKLSSYKKRLGDLENRYKQVWINGVEQHHSLEESNQKIWKMKRTAEQDRRRSLGRGIFHSPLLELASSGESKNKNNQIIENVTEKQKNKQDAPKISLTTNQVHNSEFTLNGKDEADITKQAENPHLNKRDEQTYKDKYNIAKEVARMRLKELKDLRIIVEQLRQQVKDQVP
ncbi:uncharacterized protein LOC108741300 [Agrilus planipennis]|uniref:Uncharacterized protein LOC108741300 n=1 Tax=Agrilus planipennis TaxID=224129 RepID=A0A1W4XFL4_AGRPL|nr:uncharacterized protein LOC108741300 [Agrilus planipennis]